MDEDILYFQLSDEALKKRIRGGEKFVGYSILALGILILLSLLFLEVPFRWPYLIGGLIFLWLFIESGTYLIRKQRLKHWGNYKIGYENKVIFELRNNEKTAEIFRDHVTEIEDIHSGIEVSDKDVSLIVPYDLIDFDQLEVRLENWRPPGSSPEARRLRRIANLNQASNEREEQTRMMEARKVKNRREFLSLFSNKRKRY